ncbi:hypothetical protein Fcan01_25075 [Folsomia candida]|uniref:Ionotropic glutamate receptor C-terminal domain-containing protein n=1 Tax=Folsomia candida TaxID=158441 RepID=A0A226D4A4_FOLCA|nr:hypothetical protein Fcan01_25075 [Folsomia candida]
MDLFRIIVECKKLIRSNNLRDGFNWKRQNLFKSFTGMKPYSMQDSLNGVLTYMLSLATNSSVGVNRILISTSIESTTPFSLNFTDTDIMTVSFILVGNWSFSFVTCSSLSQSAVDYWGYLKPLDSSVWYSLICLSLLVTILLIGQNYTKFMALNWHELGYAFFNGLLDVGFILVERSSSTLHVIFQNSEKLVILWTLVAFVVVNIYKSIVTEETTAPLTSNPPRVFNDLVDGGFKLYSSPISDRYKFIMPQTLTKYRWGMSEFDANIASRCLIWRRTLLKELRNTVVTLRQLCASPVKMVEIRENESIFCKGLNLTSFYEANHNLVTQAEEKFKNIELGRIAGISNVLNTTLISEILGKCDKTAFVAPSVFVMSKSYLLKILGGTSSHLSRKPYVKSIDTAFSKRVYIKIAKWGAVSESMKDKMTNIIEGGFYKFWEGFFVHLQTLGGVGRKRENTFSPQQLNSNILTMFFILGIASGLCVIIFLAVVYELGIFEKRHRKVVVVNTMMQSIGTDAISKHRRIRYAPPSDHDTAEHADRKCVRKTETDVPVPPHDRLDWPECV